MLFDLTSPGRKNVVRVVFGFLAVIFVVGFIGFGIGGEVGGGGIVDSITGQTSSTSEQYEQQIEDAEEKLESDPENPRALEDLVRYRFLSGQTQLELDETGQPIGMTDESRDEFEAAIEAWNRYLETDPNKPDVTAANNAVFAYRALNDPSGAADAQEILAETTPSAASYFTLAELRYLDLDLKRGDAAAEKVLEEANKAQRKGFERQLDGIRKQVVKLRKQQKKEPEGSEGNTLTDPFGTPDPAGGTGGVQPISP